MELSKRVQSVSASPTLAISAKAKQLKDEGHDVIGLGVGEPDFNTPDYILKAATNAMEEGKTKYTPASGLVDLKEAIVQKMKNDHQLIYNTDDVIVTTGAKFALYALCQSILNDGDEVIIPTPYWVSYPEHVKLAGGKPVYVEGLEANNFKITKEQIENVITDRTKAIIINSPSNPTGMIYTKKELEAIAEVCLEHNILIISDEIYERLIYGKDEHVSIAELNDRVKEQTVIINGVSKSHAMTGWRIGYAVGPKNIIKAMSNLASHATSNPTSIAQFAALEAYTNEVEDQLILEKMKETFAERLNKVYAWIKDIPGFTCEQPKGAFYIFPNVIKAVKMNGFSTVDEWAEALLVEEKVAIVPGSGFGAPENIRLSYATSLDQLEEAVKRIKRFVENRTV